MKLIYTQKSEFENNFKQKNLIKIHESLNCDGTSETFIPRFPYLSVTSSIYVLEKFSCSFLFYRGLLWHLSTIRFTQVLCPEPHGNQHVTISLPYFCYYSNSIIKTNKLRNLRPSRMEVKKSIFLIKNWENYGQRRWLYAVSIKTHNMRPVSLHI